ncbi:hypothetical protein OHQ89_02905 [Streptomyces canus]|uniref:hypothetical protein n=1 Tax=Streptomyces canus TaxID=58343 RepID=UPI0030E3FBD1
MGVYLLARQVRGYMAGGFAREEGRGFGDVLGPAGVAHRDVEVAISSVTRSAALTAGPCGR